MYLPSFQIPFLWDDKLLIVEDRFLRSWRFFPDLFGPSFYQEVFHQSYYRPLQGVSFLVDYQLWGLNPLGFHLTSVSLHLVNTALVFYLAWTLLGVSIPAFFAGLIFLVHPVQVAAVGYLSGRADPLAACGVLLGVIGWLKFRRGAGPSAFFWYLTALAGALAAWLSKEAGLILPLLLLWADRTALNQGRPIPWAKRWIPFAPLVFLFLLYLAVRAHLGFGGHQPPLEWAGRIFTVPRMLVTYLRIFLLPVDLHMERRIPWVTSWFAGAVWFPAAALAAVLWLAWRFRRDRALLFGAGWFFLTWLPVSGLVVQLDPNMADHWLYLPLAGLALVTAAAKARLAAARPRWRKWIGLEAGLWILFLSGISLHRIWVWQEPVRVYEEALRFPPGSAKVHSNLGNILLSRGRVEQAIQHYQEALRGQPRYAEALNNLGTAYDRAGRESLAREQYVRALEADPSFTPAAFNLIALDLRSGRLDEAQVRLRSMVPRGAREEIHWALIDVELAIRRGELDEAQRKLHLTLKVHPEDPELLKLQGLLEARRTKASP
ncbi:MAG: tetratricopeptide repeat protein [Candidatus Omnitrophica bacterium]|nr:tetratricopeptide repeat protein [Candidatus Omnitrophota bacterium]